MLHDRQPRHHHRRDGKEILKDNKTMTPIEAFELAIELAVTAPTDEKAEQATILAEEIAMQLTHEQVQEIMAKFETIH